MPLDSLSHFDEKSGVVSCITDWGCWWQTVHEVHIEVNLPKNTKAKEVSVRVCPNEINCTVCKNIVFKGRLYSTVHADETVWTVEDNKLLSIVLAKADVTLKDEIWESLLEGDMYKPDPLTLHKMRQKLDLERFQIENPGFDFSHAKLSKSYDHQPGWSVEALKKKGEDGTEKQT
ncbi:NudC domain-containing protein 2 [Cryptotermes secundus]|uniref:NudC domain-containing protein 2 n=1 Tax=Cryptotermes secundus TaxID=105785 RepID=A0A2J7PZ11_9NEOP|nr:nudC domain-containing protein 2 [Cryptotermes secundus]XP_023719382.1 nudC domain-containing protein 2 [Cryptotermes secundus]XP_023719383.1 nudC domain-containing protein 2 [Cryptotermes secundus]XP_023719384.1 nudC domain-containing protein 2 [Cryptotermes secundus]XP_023719385.1 nudC domain-containing protein 2 [Cryptotermes secundus]PNF21573.1 NudC domain-containing protein 2 [Cryptotermes secundus]